MIWHDDDPRWSSVCVMRMYLFFCMEDQDQLKSTHTKKSKRIILRGNRLALLLVASDADLLRWRNKKFNELDWTLESCSSFTFIYTFWLKWLLTWLASLHHFTNKIFHCSIAVDLMPSYIFLPCHAMPCHAAPATTSLYEMKTYTHGLRRGHDDSNSYNNINFHFLAAGPESTRHA